MILRFRPDATLEQRASVEAALRAQRIGVVPAEGALLLRRTLRTEVLEQLAAMPGVAELVPSGRKYSTLRIAVLGWLSAACAVLGVLTLFAAQLPASLGSPADPLRMSLTPRPSWPLLPLHGLVESAPAWYPATVPPLVAFVLIVFWPLLGRRLAQARPRTHAALGVLVILAAVWFAVSGLAP